MNPEIDRYRPVAEAVALLLAAQAEVVLHDFETGKIAAIFNGFSHRKAGDLSLLDEKRPPEGEEVFPPYRKTNWDGRALKSVSAVLKNDAGDPIGLLCINLDLSKWEEMHRFLQSWIEAKVESSDFLFKNDWREKINLFVSRYLKEKGLQLASLSRAEKQKLLMEIEKAGAFETKHAASYVAEVLRISRATVYNYLKVLT